MKIKSLLLGIILILTSSPCFGKAWFDGNDLKQDCASTTDSCSLSFCYGYVAAATSTAGIKRFCKVWKEGKLYFKVSSVDGCEEVWQINLPKSMQLDQAKAVVLKYLNDNPAELHKAACNLVEEALNMAFGFRKSQ